MRTPYVLPARIVAFVAVACLFAFLCGCSTYAYRSWDETGKDGTRRKGRAASTVSIDGEKVQARLGQALDNELVTTGLGLLGLGGVSEWARRKTKKSAAEQAKAEAAEQKRREDAAWDEADRRALALAAIGKGHP